MNVENKTKIHSLPDYETIVSSISSYRISVLGTIALPMTELSPVRSKASFLYESSTICLFYSK
ncbi:hypothetical protein [Bacteroides pyogenes]|uniref:hypothetical protein n=1 Tax=Bacteroides pyogenes TaxID=310300 RepID=UPI001BA87D43|nr:hypothetical protein [Bacteroides pyogenes]